MYSITAQTPAPHYKPAVIESSPLHFSNLQHVTHWDLLFSSGTCRMSISAHFNTFSPDSWNISRLQAEAKGSSAIFPQSYTLNISSTLNDRFNKTARSRNPEVFLINESFARVSGQLQFLNHKQSINYVLTTQLKNIRQTQKKTLFYLWPSW